MTAFETAVQVEECANKALMVQSTIHAVQEAIMHGDFDGTSYDWTFSLLYKLLNDMADELGEMAEQILKN